MVGLGALGAGSGSAPCTGAGAELGDRFPTIAPSDLNRVLAGVWLGTSLPFGLVAHSSPTTRVSFSLLSFFFVSHSMRVMRTFWNGDEFQNFLVGILPLRFDFIP